MLSGHTHQSVILPIVHDHGNMLAAGAPTALSIRKRGEENGYWVIDISPDHMLLSLRSHVGRTFETRFEEMHRAERYLLRLNHKAVPIDQVDPRGFVGAAVLASKAARQRAR